MEDIYTVCIHGDEDCARYIPTAYKHVVCTHGGEFFHQDYSFSKYSYDMCSHEGEGLPGIFLYGI